MSWWCVHWQYGDSCSVIIIPRVMDPAMCAWVFGFCQCKLTDIFALFLWILIGRFYLIPVRWPFLGLKECRVNGRLGVRTFLHWSVPLNGGEHNWNWRLCIVCSKLKDYSVVFVHFKPVFSCFLSFTWFLHKCLLMCIYWLLTISSSLK